MYNFSTNFCSKHKYRTSNFCHSSVMEIFSIIGVVQIILSSTEKYTTYSTFIHVVGFNEPVFLYNSQNINFFDLLKSIKSELLCACHRRLSCLQFECLFSQICHLDIFKNVKITATNFESWTLFLEKCAIFVLSSLKYI